MILMELLKESPRPRPRPRIQTGKKTLRNRVVWSDETSEDPYSEITYTVPWGEGYAVIPTVDANGNKLSVPDALEKTLNKQLLTSSGNPLDFVTGEELPVFSTEEEANRYAQWRSDTMFDPEAIAAGFDRAPTQIFPDAPPPEVDNRSIANKVINKLNRLLAYTGIKAYRGEIEGFDEGALVEQRPMSFSGVAAPDTKGLSYSEIILDSIIGLENNYETAVEGIVKQFNQDRIGFLKTLGKTIYDETVNFMYSPVDLPGLEKVNPMVAPELKVAEFGVNIANELKQAVERLSSQDLNTRLQSMFGVDYNNATDDQVSKARESVLGDGLIVAEVIPAVRAASKAVPGEVKADLMGQTRALLEGDIVEFSQTSSQPPKGVGANVPGMFPERVEEPDLEFDVEDFEFFELQDKFIDLEKQKSIKFTDSFVVPALVNDKLDTKSNITDNGELYDNLEYLAYGPNTQTFVPSYKPSFKNDALSDEEYTTIMNANDPTVPGVLLGAMDDLDFVNGKNLNDVVKPEYFKQVQADIKQSIENTFRINIDNLDPTDVFTLVGLLRRRDELSTSIFELKRQKDDYKDKIPEFNAVRVGIQNTVKQIIEDLKLTDDILVSDPRDYIKDAFKKPGEDVIDLTPRQKKIDVDTQVPYYETDKGQFIMGGGGELKYKFASVFGIEPKDSGIFYGSPDAQSFSMDLETSIENHLRNKLDITNNKKYTLETIAGRNFDELSDMYANQYLKNLELNKEIPDSNLTYIAREVLTELFEKTNQKVIRGGTIVKALQNDPRVNNKTIPPYFLSNEFKNRVFKNDKKGGPGMFDLPSNELDSLLIEYTNRSPEIKYEQALSGYGTAQRQESEFSGNFTGGEAIDYQESQITATDRKTRQSPFAPMLTHYDDRTLAHTRVSTIDPTTAPLLDSKKGLELYQSIIGSKPFKLVQEIQSDLVSKGVQKFKKIEVTSETVKKIFNKPREPVEVPGPRRITASNYNNRFPAFNANQDLIEKYGIDNYELDPEKGEEVFKTVAAALEDFANQPDTKDAVMAKQKYDALTKKTVDAQKLKYKNLSVSEKFDMLFDFVTDSNTFTSITPGPMRGRQIINRLISADMSNKELAAEIDLGGHLEENGEKFRNFLLAYNDFKRNGTIPNDLSILDDTKDIYMENLSKEYARYLNNFTSNLTGIDYHPRLNPDGIRNFSAQVDINNAALSNPSRFKEPPIKVKDTKGIEDYVSLIVQNLINNADADGIDKIVFPSVDRILERRFGGEKLKYALQNKSWSRDTGKVTDGHPLYKAYGIALPKVLDQFEKTYGIKIYRDVELPYGKSGRDLNNKGIIIDISDMKKKFDLSRPAYAKGGTVMNEQMEMAFMKQGGIKDDGMTKDPISGNEIPSGSMATEVRDNIPAMLSEGEYVVPADVLRYYGVNFFENLRNQAKNNLQTMEQNGRIGGTPMTQQDVARNMQQPVAANTGPAMIGQPSDYTSGFSPATARLNTPMFMGTSSQLANVATAQQEAATQEVTTLVTHYDKDGNQTQVKYVSVGGSKPKPADGQDDLLKQYNMTETQYADYKKTQNQSQGSSKKPNPFEKPKVDKIGPLVNIGAMDAVGIKEWATGHLKETGLQKATKPFGPLIQSLGYGEQARRIAEVRAMAKYRESLGGDDNLALAKILNDQADALVNNPGMRALDALGLMSGNQIYKEMVGYKPGQSQPSLPNANNGQTKPYMFTDDNGNPLTASNYQFAEALAGTYGWEARHFAVQQQASMKLAEKGIEDNTYYGGGTQGNDITEANNPSGGDSSGGAEAARLAAIERQKAIEEVKKEQETNPTEELEVKSGGEDRGLDEGGLMTTPKKKKRGRPKKSGLAGKK